jgi:putative peptidoglycan lipid II flippase
LLMTLAEPIVRLLFEHGKFTEASTLRVAYALACLAPGLVLFSTVNILARAFYALSDTKTPMQISLVCLTLNLAAAAVLLPLMHEGGPGIANTLTSCINAGLLLFALRKKLGQLELASLRQTLRRLLPLTILAGLVAYEGWRLWETLLGHGNLALKLGAVFVPAGIAGLIYWLAALALKIPEAREMTDFALARFRR